MEYWAVDGRNHLDEDLARLCKNFDGSPYAGRGEIVLSEWVSLTWAAVVQSDDPRHIRAGTRCEEIESSEGVMFYAAKYISKIDSDAVGNAGRFWGVHNVTAVPWPKRSRSAWIGSRPCGSCAWRDGLCGRSNANANSRVRFIGGRIVG